MDVVTCTHSPDCSCECPLVFPCAYNSHSSTHHPLQGGWTGVLAAARYGHAQVLRELITKYGCDKNATKRVSHAFCTPYMMSVSNLLPSGAAIHETLLPAPLFFVLRVKYVLRCATYTCCMCTIFLCLNRPLQGEEVDNNEGEMKI